MPGSTQIRIGGNENILIDGIHQRISINTTGTDASIGVQDDGTTQLVFDNGTQKIRIGEQSSSRLQLALNDGTRDVLKLGDVGSSFTGLAFTDASFDRVFIGKTATGSYVAKLSQNGYDAKTATDDQLIWSSEFNSFKIVTKLSTAFNISSGAGGSVGSFTLAHSLGYKPFGVASINVSSSTYGTGVLPLPYAQPSLTVVGGITVVALAASITIGEVTDTTYSFSYGLGQNVSIIGTATVYVLRETAN